MGGVEPAYTFTKRALEAGKCVCTSNKELVARHGLELLEIAKEKEINYLYINKINTLKFAYVRKILYLYIVKPCK